MGWLNARRRERHRALRIDSTRVTGAASRRRPPRRAHRRPLSGGQPWRLTPRPNPEPTSTASSPSQTLLRRPPSGGGGRDSPCALMFLMSLGWVGVDPHFPGKLAVAILGECGVGDTWLPNLVVCTVVMVIQVLMGLYGFYAILTFEK